jgi:hypothetical protein
MKSTNFEAPDYAKILLTEFDIPIKQHIVYGIKKSGTFQVITVVVEH